MATIRLRGMEIPLDASWYNPQYRAGVRHCFAVLSGVPGVLATDTFEYEGIRLFVESDMWHIAAALSGMSKAERERHGWIDLFPLAVMNVLQQAGPVVQSANVMPDALTQAVHLTGIASLDQDHQAIHSTLFVLHNYSVRNPRVTEVVPVLLRLLSQTRAHFDNEETMMAEVSYPLASSHAKEHRSATTDMQTAITRFTDGKIDITAALVGFSEWERDHILYSDQAYVDFILSNRD